MPKRSHQPTVDEPTAEVCAPVTDGSPPGAPPDAPTLRVRPVGRPRAIDGPAASLSVWLPVAAYDRLVLLSERRRMSVSAYVREMQIILTR